MAAIPGTILAAKISPGDTASTFPTHEDIYGKGGLITVEAITDLEAIYTDRQKLGMLVYVEDTTSYYTVTSVGTPPGYTKALEPSNSTNIEDLSEDLNNIYPNLSGNVIRNYSMDGGLF